MKAPHGGRSRTFARKLPEEALQDERIHALAMEVDAKQAQDFNHGVPKPGARS